MYGMEQMTFPSKKNWILANGWKNYSLLWWDLQGLIIEHYQEWDPMHITVL
jgi:hypothetical protein